MLLAENSADGAWALDRILEGVGDDPGQTNLGVCIDVGHALTSSDLPGGTVFAYLERYRRSLRHLHLHDNDGRADDHQLPGNGGLDWDALGRWIREEGIAVPAVLELHAEGDPLAAIKTAIQRLATRGVFSLANAAGGRF
jgi:sugar phosphate isomerase/epimerase